MKSLSGFNFNFMLPYGLITRTVAFVAKINVTRVFCSRHDRLHGWDWRPLFHCRAHSAYLYCL